MSRPTRAAIRLDNLRHNAALAARLAPDSRLMAVIKADGYGHGARAVAGALHEQAAAFAVASLEEATALREHGVTRPILMLEGPFEAAEITAAAELGIWLMITGEAQLRWVMEARPAKPLCCWLKIDTGMHRLGIFPREAQRYLDVLSGLPHVERDVVLCSHFSRADETDAADTQEQLSRFLATCPDSGCARSAANSPAVLAWPQAHLDWIRPGYLLYGDSPFATAVDTASDLRPVMTLHSRVIGLREIPPGDAVGYGATWRAERPSRIATVTTGYADGYPRTAGNGTPVLINGRRAPLVGRVSMDMLTVDVTDLPPVGVGDPAILWGEGLPVGEVAQHAGTIGYELLARMPARVPRELCE
jgi:alanine racemase